jgi:1-deoxy-D-xylulose-5-phosphate reductoisomerase
LQNVTILGSTGTIGQQTLDVIRLNQDQFAVYALAANTNVNALFIQCKTFFPKYAVMLDQVSALALEKLIHNDGLKTEVLSGLENLELISSSDEVDVVMAAIVGAAGLKPAMAAAKAGKRILLANKETLVMAGNLFMDAVKKFNATLLPIDSEHNAIFQVMPTQHYTTLSEVGIKKILLTASGGPFRNFTQSQLNNVTKEMALKHPNWVMGSKITIDSSTLMNKGLEVIEAHWLFNAKHDEIDVIVHPQSIIHSMVEYIDGSVLAQLGNPDMRTPIAYGLSYPKRLNSGVNSLNFRELSKLEFEEPDLIRFPCLRLAFDALKIGGVASAVLNAANEIAVEAFLNEQIHFVDIPCLLEDVLEQSNIVQAQTIEELLDIDLMSRNLAKSWLKKGSSSKVLLA